MDKILYLIKKIIPTPIFRALQPAYHFLLSLSAALFYGWPSERMIVIGVTGTTGKTTCAYLIAKMLENAGFRVGYSSTAMFSDGKKEWLNDKKMTMVGRFFMQKLLRDMLRNKCQYAIVETTSEGIKQFRHRFINYDTVVYTGLYPEHIESHGSFEEYKKAKGELFAHLKKCSIKYTNNERTVVKSCSPLKKIGLNHVKKTIIFNGDDKYADYFSSFWAEEKIDLRIQKLETKVNNNKILLAKDLKSTDSGTEFEIDGIKIDLNILGEFNVFNALTAVGVGKSQDLSIDKIKKGLESIKGIPGRLEQIDEGQKFRVIVDYAFEPNAVKKLYETVKNIEHKKIIHVLGSTGGGRDIARRPKLGEIAGKNADYVIVTNEDPYDDDPQTIIDEVGFGAEKVGKKKKEDLFKILDRKKAISKAFSLAKVGDMVLITGKGSEQAICVAGGEKIEWDDREVVREELKKMLT